MNSYIYCWPSAVNPNSIRKFLANGLSTFFIKGKPVFSNDPRTLPKNVSDYPILCSGNLKNSIFDAKLFAKALQNFETLVLVNNSLCEKLF